ncbi:hypothetical protein AB0K09_04155 [Streptomyces sp. NPDC049577]|uniref:hypothetical protein n=1 Tax=Streptomyces sp. NPDC049577 TaxID=3155153 RepID=UPI00341AE456
MTPEERTQRAKLAAHMSWAKTADPTARTAKAREAAMDRFEKEADPEGVLPPAERARIANHLKKAHFARMALESAKKRRLRAA